MKPEKEVITFRLLEGLAEISKAITEKRYLDDILALIVSVVNVLIG